MTTVQPAPESACSPVTGDAIRLIILEQSYRARVGHIGSALSVADLIAACFDGGLNLTSPADPNRDLLVMSKGHAALALYAAFRMREWIDDETLSTYCCDGSLLGVHPDHRLPGVDFSTGSLGQGLSIGVGTALAARLTESSRRVAVLMSDAECNEGSVWEAAAFAAQHRLSQLRVIIDSNGQQALGYTSEVLEPTPLAARFDAFGWDVRLVDGHDRDAIVDALRLPAAKPAAIVAKTTFGSGVSFMEQSIPWHYLPMTAEQFLLAVLEVTK
jgi:transketolase